MTIKGDYMKRKSTQNIHFNQVERNNVTDVNEDPENMTVTIDEDIPENNSALQNQNTENISDEEEDDETIEEF
jgi:hypothetical protein